MLRAMILVLLLPISAMAAPRPVTGLLTKGSNLPATIPLQVRAPGDSDHAVILQDQDGQPRPGLQAGRGEASGEGAQCACSGSSW